MYPQEEDVSSSTPRTPSEPTLSSNPAWRNPMDSRGPDEVNRGALVIAGTAGGGGGDVSGEVSESIGACVLPFEKWLGITHRVLERRSMRHR